METCRKTSGILLFGCKNAREMVGVFRVRKHGKFDLEKHQEGVPPQRRDQAEEKKVKKGEEPEKKVNLQITAEGVVAVQEFNLDITDKEFIVLVGPSGCGKSTTLRMIAGLEDISGGELYIGDRLVNDVPPKDRDIAMPSRTTLCTPT